MVGEKSSLQSRGLRVIIRSCTVYDIQMRPELVTFVPLDVWDGANKSDSEVIICAIRYASWCSNYYSIFYVKLVLFFSTYVAIFESLGVRKLFGPPCYASRCSALSCNNRQHLSGNVMSVVNIHC